MSDWIYCFLVLSVCCQTILTALNVTPNPQYSFEQCLVSKTSLGYCVGITALNKLQNFDNDPQFDIVDGVTLARDEQQPRGILNFLERDPSDFGGILDTMSHLMSYRTLRWDMSTIYPGLLMRVSPSVDGVLEFVMDPLQDEFLLKNSGGYKEIGTARVLARHFLVPFLLGFKFKVATLIPIIFGILALLAKKALFVSKAALVVSSSLALGTLLLGSHNDPFSGHHNYHYSGSPSYNHQPYPSWSNHHHYKSEEPLGEYSDVVYKGYTNGENEQDQLKFSQMSPQQQYERNNNEGRNFAWNESEKGIKS